MTQDYADGKNIRSFVGDLEIRLFGTHEVRFPGYDLAFIVREKPARLGDPKIRQLHITFEGDHDIFETHIAMHDAERTAILISLRMRISQPATDTAGDEHRHFHWERLPFLEKLVAELFEINPSNQLHGDVIHALRFAQ